MNRPRVLLAGNDGAAGSATTYYLRAEACEQVADHHGALAVWTDAYELCRGRGLDEAAQVCLARLLTPLRHTGQWGRAVELCWNLLHTPDTHEPARMVAAAEFGLILAARGQPATARPHLRRSLAFAEAHRMLGLELDATWGLARADAIEGQITAAIARLDQLVRRCAEHDGRGVGPALRWAASFFSRRGLAAAVSGCTAALSRVAAATGAPDARAAFGCAVAEEALLADEPHAAAGEFERALALLAPLGMPAEKVEVQVRAGVALAAAGQRERAVAHLVEGHRTATALRAAPLAGAAANELAALGAAVRAAA
jgi:hypothetical protein